MSRPQHLNAELRTARDVMSRISLVGRRRDRQGSLLALQCIRHYFEGGSGDSAVRLHKPAQGARGDCHENAHLGKSAHILCAQPLHNVGCDGGGQ